MRLLIMGPPGVGTGTQAVGIAAHYGIPAISTGDIFRANVKNQTPLGQEVSRIMAEGGYVPDEITNAIVADRLTEADAAEGARVTVRAGDTVIAEGRADESGDGVSVIPAAHLRPWSPEDPFLYDVDITLGEDRVASYFGMRKFFAQLMNHGFTANTRIKYTYTHV